MTGTTRHMWYISFFFPYVQKDVFTRVTFILQAFFLDGCLIMTVFSGSSSKIFLAPGNRSVNTLDTACGKDAEYLWAFSSFTFIPPPPCLKGKWWCFRAFLWLGCSPCNKKNPLGFFHDTRPKIWPKRRDARACMPPLFFENEVLRLRGCIYPLTF